MSTPSSEQIDQTVRDFCKVRGSAVLIGGIAVIHYGYERSTKDVDALYSNVDEFDLLRRLKKDFKRVNKVKNGWHHFEHRRTKVRLELIPEGGLTTNGFIPGPKAAGRDGDFISLKGLAWLKLVSGRAKDIADLVEIMKANLEAMKGIGAQLPPELHEPYANALAQAKTEIENDPNRQSDDLLRETPSAYGRKKPRAKRKAAAK